MSWRACASLLASVAAFAQVELGTKGVNFYSREKEAAIGAQYAEEVRRSNKLLDSAAAREYVERIGGELADQRPGDWPAYTFEVLDGSCKPIEEPFALPGGYIFVHARLFLAAESEAEFAGMLAHAMAHAAARHATRQATRGQLVHKSSIPLIFMDGWACNGGQFTEPMAFRSFRRANELEADRIAAQIMARAGFDPAALARYIERMQAGGADTPKLHSPLPPLEARLAGLRQAIADQPAREYRADTADFERVREEVRTVERAARRPPSLR